MAGFERMPIGETTVDADALLTPVPNMDELRRIKQGYGDVPIDTTVEQYNEPVVSLPEHGVAGRAYYSLPHEFPNGFHLDPVPGVGPEQYLRRSVAETLARLNELVKAGEITDFFGGEIYLYVEDALRPVSLQQKLYDEVFPGLIRGANPGISDEDMTERRKDLIAKPSLDSNRPSPHATGAVFDITLKYVADGSSVEFGHFDGNVQPTVNPDYFETHEPENDVERLAQRNRRAFYAIMTGAAFGIETGFVNNPTEFWHWGRGDQLSARVSGNEPAVYSLAEPS